MSYIFPIALNFWVSSTALSVNFILEKSLIEVARIIVTMKTGYSLSINSENKQASFLNVSNGEEHSAYDSIDHSYNSFIYIDQGLYKLKEPQGVQMKITYKKWVAD